MANTITTKGVIVIDGKQVDDTYNGLRRTIRGLESDLKKLKIGSDEYVATSQKLKEVKARFQEINNEIRGTNKTLNESSKEFESVGGTFGGFKSKMLDMFSGVASGKITFKELGGQKQREALAASEKELQDSENRKLEIINKTNAEKLKLQQESYEKEIAEANAARSEEFRKLAEDGDKMLLHITELENKKLKSKNPAEIGNLQKAIDKEREAIYQNDLLIQQTEETHQLKLKTIREKWEGIKFQKSVESEQRRINEDRRLAEDKINNISTMEEAELALSQMKNLKLTDQELAGIKNLEDAKRALREDADREMLKAQLKSLDEQKKQLEEQLKGLTGEAAEKLKKDLDELNSKITQVKGAINGGKEADDKKVQEEQKQAKSQVDILGFSAADWEETFSNLDTTAAKIKAAKMAIQAMSNAFQSFATLQNALSAKEISRFEKNQDKKKKELLLQLNQGYINQEEYHKGIQKLEAETENKKAEIAYKQAKAQRAIQIASAISGTALGIIGALTMQPWSWANIAAAAIVGIMGGIQIATIANTPLPEKPSFAGGGYTGSGYGSPDATGYRPAGAVHENEYVTPEWMLQNPVVADTVAWMESIRTGRIPPPKGYADGGFVEKQDNGNNNPEPAPAIPAGTMVLPPEFMALFSDLKELLQYLKDKGVDAYMVADAENGKQIKVAIKEFENIENRNKKK